MPLELTLQAETTIPIEVEGITPDRVRTLAPAAIRELDVFHGNRKLRLAELFQVDGDPSDGQIIWRGNLAGVHWIGAQMTAGRIRVDGPAGRHLGSEMRGGLIEVEGSVGDWVGGEMHGGVIRVRGSAGHLVGAAYRGSPRGMTGGTILIDGDAGHEIGHSLRRGLIVIGGQCGDLAGFNMLAGTVLVFGGGGIRHGAGMRRGTLGFFGPEPPALLPTFIYGCRCRPLFLRLLWREIQALGMAVPDPLPAAEFDLYHGDLIEGGRGEILLPAR